MTLYARFEQPVFKSILSLLKHESRTVQSLEEISQFPRQELQTALLQLCDDGLVSCEHEVYSLRRDALDGLAALFTQYGNDDEQAADETLFRHYFEQREEDFSHAAFESELSFYEGICSGNLEVVMLLMTPLGGEGYGRLSNNPLQNLKYHLVITIAMITRFCLNAGMIPEEAYSLSDVYVMKADECRTEADIHKTHSEVIIEFTKRMRQRKASNVYSKPIVLTLDYISDHLHHRITIESAAKELQLSVPYLSRLFKSEVGVTFSEYIAIKKVEAAANMLQFSNYSSSEISSLLHFSSQSYFIKVFCKHTGMTPKEYKNRYYARGRNIFQYGVKSNLLP